MSFPSISRVRIADQPVYAVAGGNHVTIELDRNATDGQLDVIEVHAQPGGGPPPHSHAFGEWFLVREGELTLCEDRDGTVLCTTALHAGDSAWIAPWVVHGTLNFSNSVSRFQVVGRPGVMTGYFAEAGIQVPDPQTPPVKEPPGPDQLREISARWEIRFWTGPIDTTPPDR